MTSEETIRELEAIKAHLSEDLEYLTRQNSALRENLNRGRAENKTLFDEVLEYRKAISWDTSCLNCAKVLDHSYNAYATDQLVKDNEELKKKLLENEKFQEAQRARIQLLEAGKEGLKAALDSRNASYEALCWTVDTLRAEKEELAFSALTAWGHCLHSDCERCQPEGGE